MLAAYVVGSGGGAPGAHSSPFMFALKSSPRKAQLLGGTLLFLGPCTRLNTHGLG